MSETRSDQQKYLQELEELERSCGGVFACITPVQHKKRWEQKVSKLEAQLTVATTASEERILAAATNRAEPKGTEKGRLYSQSAFSFGFRILMLSAFLG